MDPVASFLFTVTGHVELGDCLLMVNRSLLPSRSAFRTFGYIEAGNHCGHFAPVVYDVCGHQRRTKLPTPRPTKLILSAKAGQIVRMKIRLVFNLGLLFEGE